MNCVMVISINIGYDYAKIEKFLCKSKPKTKKSKIQREILICFRFLSILQSQLIIYVQYVTYLTYLWL